MWHDGEPVLCVGCAGEIAEDLDGHFGHGSALFADQVAVGGFGEVVGGRAVAEVGTVHDLEPFQFLKVAVDRGHVHVRGIGTNLGGQFLGTTVLLAPEQRLQQQPARGCRPAALLANEGNDILDRGVTGVFGWPRLAISGHGASLPQHVQLQRGSNCELGTTEGDEGAADPSFMAGSYTRLTRR